MAAPTSSSVGAKEEAPMSSSLSTMAAPTRSSVATKEEAPMSSSLDIMEAPMSCSLGAMGPLLRQLDLLLAEPCRLGKSVHGRINQLRQDLGKISAALVNLSAVGETPKPKASCWMNQVRQLSYDIQDCIDNIMPLHSDGDLGSFSTDGLPKKKLGSCMAKISKLSTLVLEANQRYKRYNIADCCISSSRCVFAEQRLVLPTICGGSSANYLVGIDNLNKKEHINWLTNKAEPQLKVVAIVGSAGVGKTTFARQLYHDLRGQFECSAFVRATRKPDMTRLLREILSQVLPRRQSSGTITVQNLIDNLREHLEAKRYFMLIDDLWETTSWDIINCAFPEGNNMSRIIITSQIDDVALKCCHHQSGNILNIMPLVSKDSRKLFFNIVFGPRQCPEELKDISYSIIKKCGGSALATVTVASLLAAQQEKSEEIPHVISKKELFQHVEKYLCTLNADPISEDTLKEIINLSYNSLPHYLKTCLLYVRMYPEGYTIWKVDLMNQWIAEGFIRAKDGKDKTEIAESYFDEFVNRGMLQPLHIINNDEVLSCAVHHLVLDLITQKSEEQKFVTAIDYSHTTTRLSSRPRRLSLHFSIGRYATKPAGITLSQVRTHAFFGLFKCMPSIEGFELIRVLILDFWGDHQYGSLSFNLTRIDRLLLLKYLKISSDIAVELPSQMRGLQYLEALKADARVSTIPLDIVHLPSLLHLRLRDEAKLPNGIGRITSLCTLEYFDLCNNSEENVSSLGELTNLRDLHLTCCASTSDEHDLRTNLKFLASSLGKLGNLKSVTMTPGASCMPITFYDGSRSLSSLPIFLQKLELVSPICMFSRLPSWLGQLCQLRILKVVVRELLKDDINNITELPVLTVLSLYVRTALENRILFKSGAFPVLKYFKFRCSVLNLDFQAGALPNLQRLTICFNAHKGDRHNHILAGIEHLPDDLQEIAGRIGIDTGADENDWTDTKLIFENSIGKHLSCPRFNVQLADPVDEEYRPSEKLHQTEGKYSYSSDEQGGIFEEELAEDKDSEYESAENTDSEVPQFSDMPKQSPSLWKSGKVIRPEATLTQDWKPKAVPSIWPSKDYGGSRGTGWLGDTPSEDFRRGSRASTMRLMGRYTSQRWGNINYSRSLSHPYDQTDDEYSSSNVVLLENPPDFHYLKKENPPVLEVSRLENVKSVEEAQRIKLVEKKEIRELKFEWTRDAMRFVEDMEVLGDLVPPIGISYLSIRGYNSTRLPDWLMGIPSYNLPNLTMVWMWDLSECKNLPPLGQLPNLRRLTLGNMQSLEKIDEGFYGSAKAFPRLRSFLLRQMENLEVWNTTYTCDGNELMFPDLEQLYIEDCPKLRLKPCRPRSKKWIILRSDGVLSSGGKSLPHARETSLDVNGCQVPMHQWRLLDHIPGLTELRITDCKHPTSSLEISRALSSLRSLFLYNHGREKVLLPDWLVQLTSLSKLVIEGQYDVKAPPEAIKNLTLLQSLALFHCNIIALPQWVGDLTSLQAFKLYACRNLNDLQASIGRLTSLKTLEIMYCGGIKSLPEDIQKLAKLEYIDIYDCPDLKKWYELEDNKKKLAHVKRVVFRQY